MKLKAIICVCMLSLIVCLLPGSFSALPKVSAAAKDAVFIRSEIPDEMLAGGVYPVSVTAKNTGTDTWTSAANYKLGALAGNQLVWSQWQNGGYSNSVSDQRGFVPGYLSAGSGNGSPFNFSILAPNTVGNYNFGMQMVQDGVAFFGQTFNKSIAVKNIVIDGLPARLKASATYRVTVSVLNKGASTWTRATNYELTKVGTSFTWSNWKNGGTASTALLNASDSVATNEGISFSFDLTAPATAGTHSFSAVVKQSGVNKSDTYARNYTVVTDDGVNKHEGETLFTNKIGNKATASASGGSSAYTSGAGNTAMWKADSPLSAYVTSAGQYNIWMRVMSTKTVPLRIQMYGGPLDGISADYTPTDINEWQWIGPLKVDFQAAYSNYKLTLWKLGGAAGDFVAVDQVYAVSADVDNAYAKRLKTDEITMDYIIPHTGSGITVNAGSTLPVFYKMTGTGDSVIQLNQENDYPDQVNLQDTVNPGVTRIKIEYLGSTGNYSTFKFTNQSDAKGTDTILKAAGYGRISFDHEHFFNPVPLDDDLLPGQSVTKTFKKDWLDTTPGGNLTVKITRKAATNDTLGTFSVNPASVGASTTIVSSPNKTRLEGETVLVNRTGTTSMPEASRGNYAYGTGAGNINISAGVQGYSYYVNNAGLYNVYARVRTGNQAGNVRLQAYVGDGTSPSYDAHLTDSDKGWTWIGPLKLNVEAAKTYNLALWRLGGETNDRLEIDAVEFVRDDYHAVLSPLTSQPRVGGAESFRREFGLQETWKMIEIQQPPKSTSLYVKLIDTVRMQANKEALNVTLGANLTASLGTTINDWKINGDRVFMSWYYPYRQVDTFPNWQAKITADLEAIAANGYNVVLLQLFPQFINTGSSVNYALTEARRLGIKVLPSIYYINQHTYLEQKTGINFRDADGINDIADATDPEFSRALAKWYDMLYTDFGDIFYVDTNGKTPIMYGEEHGYGFPQGWPYGSRKAPDNIENMRVFRDWLQTKYGTHTAWNAAWGFSSSYPAFSGTDTIPNLLMNELVNTANPNYVIDRQPQYYSAKWKEGGTAMADFDAFRSSTMKTRWLDTRSRILADYPNTLFGVYTFGKYGLDDIYGSAYNYTEARPGVLGNDLAAYTDFIVTFYSTIKEVESATAYWKSKGNDLVAFIPDTDQFADLVAGGANPQKLGDGAFSDIPGLSGDNFDNNLSLFPVLKETYKLGAIPGVYAWNDYPLWNYTSADIREDIQIFADNIINP